LLTPGLSDHYVSPDQVSREPYPRPSRFDNAFCVARFYAKVSWTGSTAMEGTAQLSDGARVVMLHDRDVNLESPMPSRLGEK
jgi:hypothetical protein